MISRKNLNDMIFIAKNVKAQFIEPFQTTPFQHGV